MEKYKISALIEEMSGSSYHRVKLPSEWLNGSKIKVGEEEKEIEVNFISVERSKRTLKEEYFKDCDLVYFNWAWNNAISEVVLWKKKYNIKIVMDIDDFYIYSPNNPASENPLKADFNKKQVLKYAVEADSVICSTLLLGEILLKYNKNIAISNNFLPVGEGQFRIYQNKNEGKLKICIFGSISHFGDWLLLKPVINKLCNNKEIVKNCEFYLIGYTDNKYWNEIVKMFQKKKHVNTTVVAGRNVDEYMYLLEGMDICLIPLEDVMFNKTKSALKLAELSIKGVIPIGSELYSSKELNSFVVCKTPLDYEKTILKLIDRKVFKETLDKVVENNLRDNKIEERKQDLLGIFEATANLEGEEFIDNIKLYSLKYKEDQIVEFTPVLNQNKTTGWRFEYNSFINKLDEIKEGKENYYGFLSWKFPIKTGITGKILKSVLLQYQYNDFDFINLAPMRWKTTEDYLKFSYQQHPNLEKLLSKILDNLNVQDRSLPEIYTYSNFFIMKKENWIDYLENWVIPSLNYMENEIFDEVNIDANYKSGISSEELFENTGCKFYNMVTFLLERLIIFYIQNKNLKAISLI